MQLWTAVEAFDLSKMTEVAPKTRHGYLQRLRVLIEAFGESRDVATITTDDLRRWRASLSSQRERYVRNEYRPTERGGLSVATIRTYIQCVRSFFGWLLDEGVIAVNPAARLGLPTLPDAPPKAVTDGDRDALLEVARRTGRREYAIVMFLADTGCRVGGLVSLTMDRVELRDGRATVVEKGARSRTVYLVGETVEALQSWIEYRPVCRYMEVFLSTRDAPYQENGIYQLLRRLGRKAGIKGRVNPHAFRHAFARSLLNRGADLSTVSQLMGHRSPDVTARFYARWSDKELAAKHELFSPLSRLTTRDESGTLEGGSATADTLPPAERVTTKNTLIKRVK